jgi:hypothetical protein
MRRHVVPGEIHKGAFLMLSCFIDGIVAGSQTFTSSGTFTVPAYNTLAVTVNGAGGGGAGGAGQNEGSFPVAGNDGDDGHASKFTFGSNPPTGNGGKGGSTIIGHDGDDGTASGGTTNTTGGGAAGGQGGGTAGDGGNGGKAAITYTSASGPGFGASITVTVGAGGAGGTGGQGEDFNGPDGTAGGNGSVVVQWS